MLDVGAGSGILAIWAIQAGAKKAYAVEATYMATHAKRIAEYNGVGDQVEVYQGYLEEVELPENVDIIISEFMGYFLLRESMFDTILFARDKYLKPGGAIYPSHCRLFIAPMNTKAAEKKYQEFKESLEGWDDFCRATAETYGVDLSCLTDDYEREQKGYFLQTALWSEVRLHPLPSLASIPFQEENVNPTSQVNPSQLLGPSFMIKDMDLHKVFLEDVQGVNSWFRFKLRGGGTEGTTVNAFCGWFDVHFRGSEGSPVDSPIEMTTAPEYNHCTHWGQQAFLIDPPIESRDGDVLEGRISVKKHRENKRLLDIGMVLDILPRNADDDPPSRRSFVWHLD